MEQLQQVDLVDKQQRRQESHAVAKTTERCAQYMGETIWHVITVDIVLNPNPNPILNHTANPNPIPNPNSIPNPNLNRYYVLTVLYPVLGRVAR